MADDVQSLLNEAAAAVKNKDWDKGIELYQSVMEADTTNEEACSKLAELYAVRGLISNVIETYFTLMDILDQKGEHELAVEVARWIMKLQPENDKARMKTILIYKQKGNMEEVVKQSLQLARLYIELGQGDQSILLLKNAQDIAPENLDIGLELAEMYISHGHIPEGTAQYQKIANAYLGAGDKEKAAEAFRRMKIVQPDEPNLLFTLGNLYMDLGKLNEAEGEFRAILRHNLNHTDALMSLGKVCQKKGQFRDAILAFNKILSVNPENEFAKERLGELYQAQGATSEAVKFFLQAASTYQFDENFDRAIKLYQRVIALDPTNPTACRELTNMGAPITPEEGMEEEIYAPSITSMEVDEEELVLGEESLEEVSGAVVPPTAIDIPEEEEADEEAQEGARKPRLKRRTEHRKAISTNKFKGDITKFKRDVGSDLSFGEGRQEKTDLYFEEEEESASSRISRKPRGRKGRDLRKKIGKSGRGLVKKGLLKSGSRLKKSGLLSSKSKPSLGKKGLISRRSKSKGLFRRRQDEEEYVESEVDEMEEMEEMDEVEEVEEIESETEAIEEIHEEIEELEPEIEEEIIYEDELEESEEVIYEDVEDLEDIGPQEEVVYEEVEYEEYPEEYYQESQQDEMMDEAALAEEPLEAEVAEEEYISGMETATPEYYDEVEEEEEEFAPPKDEYPSFEEEGAMSLEDMEEFAYDAPEEIDMEAEGIGEIEEFGEMAELPEMEGMEEMAELPEMPDMPGMEEMEEMAELPDMPMEGELPEMAELPGAIEPEIEEKKEERPKLLGRKKKGLLGKKKKSLREALKMEVSEEEEEAPEIPEVAELPEMGEDLGIPAMAELPDFGEDSGSLELSAMPEMADISGMDEMAGLPDMGELPGMSGDFESSDMADLPDMSEESGDIELGAMPEMPDFGSFDEEETGEEGIELSGMTSIPEEISEPAELPDLEGFEEEAVEEFAPEAMDEYPETFTEGMDLPDLDLSGTEFGEQPEISQPEEERVPDLEAMPQLPDSLVEEDTKTGGLMEEKAKEGSVSDFDMDLELPDLDLEGQDMFDLSGDGMPAFEPTPTKRLDMDDFASSLLKLADEIEMSIPGDDVFGEMETEEEAKEKVEEEKEEGEETHVSQPTKFLELPDLMTEEISFDSPLPPMPEDLKEASEKEEKKEAPVKLAPDTVFLPPLEDIGITEVPSAIEEEEEPEAVPEVVAEEKEEIEEVIEEIPPEPEVNMVEQLHELVSSNDMGKAFEIFSEVLEQNAEDMELRKEHAELCYKYGRVDEAISSYKYLNEKEPGNLEYRKKIIRGQLLKRYNEDAVVSLLDYGNVLTAEDKIDEAQRVFQYVLALEKENPRSREALSEIYLNMDMKELALYHLNILADYMEEKNEIDNAIKVLKKIFNLTSNIKTQERLAEVYIENDYRDEAIEELINLAVKYKEKEQFERAASNYEKIVEMEPERIDAHEQLIELYNKLGDNEKFYSEKVLVADLMVGKDMLEEAEKRFEECLTIQKNDNKVRRELVDIYLKNNKLKNALEEALTLSQAYHKERKYEDAITLYNQLIEHEPRNLNLREKLSEFYVMSDQLQKGLDQLNIVAEELTSRGEWDGAIKAYKKALTIDNKNAELHYHIGEIYLNEKKNPTEARFEFNRVFELDPTHRKAMEHLVRLSLDADKPGDAIRVLKKLIELDSSYKSMEGDIISEFKQKIKDDPNDFKAHFNLGMIYKELEMWTKAIEQFQQTRKSNDYVLESHVMLGVCFSQQPPMRNLAIKTLEKGLRLKGFKPQDYIDLHYQLAVLYHTTKKAKKALKEIEEVIKIDPNYKDASELYENMKKK